MKKNLFISLGVILGISIVLSSLLYLIFGEIKMETIILIVTAVTVFWYAFETQEMRKEMVNQTMIQSTPFITISMDEEYDYLKLFADNNGEIAARNIDLEISQPLQISHMEINYSGGGFKPIDTLPKGKGKVLEIEWNPKTHLNTSLTHLFLAELRTKTLTQECLFRLKFQNIFYRSFAADVTLMNQKFQIKNFRKLS